MKKIFYFVAVATFALFSCQSDDDPINDQKGKSFTFKASIEEGITRGTINSSNGLVWTSGDQLGIYIADWGDKNQSFTLSDGAGSTQGEFTRDAESGSFETTNASVAFFPWQGTGSECNNVYNGTMYFKLLENYYSYTTGKMLTPLVAPVTYNGASYDPISFKHAGAAVKVTINNLPAGSNVIGMSVDGKQIWGSYQINPANAGTDALTVDGVADNSKNKIWLHYTNDSESEFTFIFPVPTLTTPKLSFEIWDKNGINVWSKNLKAQSSDLGRKEILIMPAIDITPYSQFDESDTWTFCGNINGGTWADDIPMCTDGTYCILSGVSFKTNDEFKIRKDKKWDEAYPASNYKVNSDCTKDVWFNISTKEITLKDAGCPYPSYR